ncbi:MAG: type II/IV secretion system protein [Desulfobacteraceae bacterium]|nr:MAG: type II/IV secretion system protein [Desulfobacteraceae bacterium]
MLNDSLSIYDQILASSAAIDTEELARIRERVNQLKNEVLNNKTKTAPRLSEGDLSLIKKTMSAAKSVKDIINNASALKELGLLRETAAEYEKLLEFDCSKEDYTPVKIVVEVLSTLFKTEPHDAVIGNADRIISENKISNRDASQIKLWLGAEMEKKGRNDVAVSLFRAALSIDPENVEAGKKLNFLISNLSNISKYDYLLDSSIATQAQLQKALESSKKTGKSIELELIENFNLKKEDVGKSLSLFYNCPFKSFNTELPVPVELISKVKKSFLIHYLWVPLSWGKNFTEILVDDPKDLRKTDHIRALMSNQNIQFCVGIKEDILKYIDRFFSAEKPSDIMEATLENLDKLIPDVSFEFEEEAETDKDIVDESSSQVVRLVDQVLITAYRKKVSDIHIEPSPLTKKTRIRFRMDGVCHEYLQVPNAMAPALLSRLKIMAGLDIAERRLPQDGKIKMKRKGVPVFELRMSTMPTAGGFEDTVLRILAKAGAMKLDDMGLNERNLAILKKIISQPYGLVLVVGPTGSGKTTTLHSALGHINKPEIKIWTAEDPVEISQPGLRQVEVKSRIGLDFARVMRGFLRLDPDVIMIGEMRDKETASIGVEASLTGHLVFSTLHTNSAPETVTRLLDMGLNPLNFSDAFLGVLAQRLTRRLCSSCKKPFNPSREEFDDIISDYGREKFAATGLEYTSDLILYRTGGCEECSGSGYKGRMGIHELMEGTPVMKNLIKRAANTEELFEQAYKENMTTLKQDGIMKVFKGMTDINEIRRVCIN